jgi:hypothetical protein
MLFRISEYASIVYVIISDQSGVKATRVFNLIHFQADSNISKKNIEPNGYQTVKNGINMILYS